MKRIIIFDVDGVLIKSVDRSIASLSGILIKHGLNVDYDLIIQNWGHSFANVLIPVLAEDGNWPDYKREIVLQEADDFFEMTHFGGPSNLKEKLDKLKLSGYDLGIITNRNSRMLEKALMELNLNKNIFDLLHSSDSGICKPDPNVFEAVFRYKRDREVVFVGDSIRCDLSAAYNFPAKIHFIGITSLIHNKKDFIEAGVPQEMIYDCVIDYIDTLLIA